MKGDKRKPVLSHGPSTHYYKNGTHVVDYSSNETTEFRSCLSGIINHSSIKFVENYFNLACW